MSTRRIRLNDVAAWCLVALLAGSFVAPTQAEGQTVVVQQGSKGSADEPATTQRLSGPPRGIRSFGSGAVRFDDMRKTADPSELKRSRVAPRAKALAAGATVKISAASMAGSVNVFALSPDGATAVYIADQQTIGRFELYSTPVDGSAAPVKISAGLPFGAGDEGVSEFRITPDGARVVFLADANRGGGANDLFSAPIAGGSTPLQLNGAAQGPATAFGVGPNGSLAAFFGSGTGRVELYVAVTNSAGSGVRVSNVAANNTNGNVVFADFSPDGARLFYAADETADEIFQWHSVLSSATGPGSDIQLSNARGFVALGAVTPNSATLVYVGDDTTQGVMELFSVPMAGGAKVKLNPVMAGDGVIEITVSADGQRVGYLADQINPGVIEVYSARVGIAASGDRLNSPLTGVQTADTLTLSPDSSTALYEADENTAGTFDLLSVPLDGSGGSATLHGMSPPDNAAYFAEIGTPVIGTRAIYPVSGSVVNLYSVPFDGGQGFDRVNAALGSGNTVASAFIPVASGATRLMAYGVGPTGDTQTRRVYVASIRTDLAREQVNVTASAGATGVLGYGITADENYAVYLQDQDATGKPELFSRELDSDGDSVVNPADSCPFVDNATQQPVTLGLTVTAPENTVFTWSVSTEVRFARGPLDQVDVLATNNSGTLTDATSLSDRGRPVSGAGFYYLFAPDCPGRSYQTVLGAEPDRDSAGLP